MKNRKKIHEIDHTNDIKYRGPLTYQHFRMAGWVFIALSQIAAIMALNESVNPGMATGNDTAKMIFSIFGQIATPLLLIANFAVILSSRTGFKKLLIRFGALSAAAVAGFFLVYERYIVGVFAASTSSGDEAHRILQDLLSQDGFIAFNLFLDLLLCTLVMFFLDYVPKKRFQGKKLIIFRLFALFPILYEAVSITLKILTGLKIITMPVYVFPFLTTKPPIGFLVFVTLALFIKRRERKYIKNGKTLKEYKAFLDTNSNSWHFSVHAAIIMAVAAILDLAIIVGFSLIHANAFNGTAQYDTVVYQGLEIMYKCGFGASIALLFVAPIMLLFSYNRMPKRPQLDKIVPIVGVALVAIVYIEGIFWLLCNKMAG